MHYKAPVTDILEEIRKKGLESSGPCDAVSTRFWIGDTLVLLLVVHFVRPNVDTQGLLGLPLRVVLLFYLFIHLFEEEEEEENFWVRAPDTRNPWTL